MEAGIGASDPGLFKAVIESMSDGMSIFDRDGRIVLLNPSLARMYGYRDPADMLQGLDYLAQVFALYDLEGREIPVAEWPVSRVLKGESIADWRLKAVRKDLGLEKIISISGNPVLDADGQTNLAVITTRDITRQFLAEESLRKSEEKYGRILETIEDGFCVIRMIFDASGRPVDYLFLETNPAFEHHTGLMQAKGRRMRDLVPDHDQSWFDLYGKVATTGQALRFENYASAMGRSFEVSATRTGRPEDGEVAVIFRDTTIVRQKEEQLRQSQRMEAIGQLAGGVAHDFNNLLTAINGYSEMLLESASKENPSREFLLEIHKSGQRAAALTSQLLAFGRKQTLHVRVVDLNEVVRENGQLLRRVIGETIDFVLDLAPNLPAMNADPNQLHQILLNLCLNARDAMPAGGRLRVATRPGPGMRPTDAPEAAPSKSSVQLEVEDTGMGMTPEVQKRIFEPFFTTKEVGKGTGLGLASVLGIVQQNGGAIEVESEPGRGALFRLRFPAIQAEAHGEETHGPSKETREASRLGAILLVEDEETVRKFVCSLLEGEGFRVSEAKDGMEALALFQDSGFAPDLVLSDVIMPRMGGVELAAALRTLRPGLRVLLMSGYTEGTSPASIDLDDATEVIQKPFSPKTLLARIQGILHPKAP
jgi:PAS domain S-box-containing protein